ncbi:MAG TPA: AraC family transcriptional regulator ligand-binding domain-containing protein [Alcanivoracaceae bacterium]|nr:AraC family transcriptional regulator ligand-binding domain-containing protein [Alcanivoracaceae bacterium]
MTFSQSARSAVFVGFEALCRKNNLNAHTLLKECALDPIILRRQDLLVNYSRVGEVLNLAAQRSGNQQFGLQLSQQRDYLVFGPFGLLLSQAESVHDLIRITNQYVHLHVSGIRLIAEEKDQDLALHYHLSLASTVDTRQLIELGVGVMFRAARLFFKDHWHPHYITFAHSNSTNTDVYKRIFAVPVLFEQASNSIVCDKNILSTPPSEQRDLVKHHLTREYNTSQATLPVDYVERTQHVLRSLLATGEANLDTVANVLGIHPRQLQIKLRESGQSFRSLLEDLRYHEAKQQLLLNNIRITDLALSLGYADETAFSRAFKRWSGLAPQQWRKQQLP